MSLSIKNLLFLFFATQISFTYGNEDMVKSKSGEMISWYQFDADALGAETFQYSSEGIRKLNPVPKPGVHPRIFFGPKDVEERRIKLKNTRAGREAWLNVLAWSDFLNSEYDPEADYAPRDKSGQAFTQNWNTSNSRVRVPISRAKGLPEDYKKLQKGEYVDARYFLPVISIEAYRALIEADEIRGKKVAAALVTYLTGKTNKHFDVSMVIQGDIASWHNLSLAYDFVFNFMTETQKEVVRKTIASLIQGKAPYGAFLEAEATVGNWATLDSFTLWTALGIEGEKGYDKRFYKAFVRAFRNYMSYGFYPSGADYESLGKNYQFPTTMVAMAMRGDNVIEHPHVRAWSHQFLPQMLLPGENSFVGYDDWGGTGWNSIYPEYKINMNEPVGFKWMFPESPEVDLWYRAWVGENYEMIGKQSSIHGYFNSTLLHAIFPSDYFETKQDPGKLGFGKTFFAPRRGILATRESWDGDSLYLHVACRQNLGGHAHADRGNFLLYGLGRLWSPWRELSGRHMYKDSRGNNIDTGLGNHADTLFHSNVLIDDIGQMGRNWTTYRVPSRIIKFKDTTEATFVRTDIQEAYDSNWGGYGPGHYGWNLYNKNPKKYEEVQETPNDFYYERLEGKYNDKAYSQFPHWLLPHEKRRFFKIPFNPVQKAYRSAGIIRGKHSYVLIMDNIKKDDTMRNYKWVMQVSDDIEIGPRNHSYHYNPEAVYADIYLSTSDSNTYEIVNGYYQRKLKKGDRMLLVRILNFPNPDQKNPHYVTPIGRVEQYMQDPRWLAAGKRLVLPHWGTEMDYKVLLFPHRYGDELPQTTRMGNRVTVEWQDQKDCFQFFSDQKGFTRFKLERNEGLLIHF